MVQRRRHRNSGVSLIEAIVVCGMIGILTAFIFATYSLGLRATFKGNAQNELLGQLQLGVRILGDGLRESTTASVTLEPAGPGISFLTSYDINGVPVVGTDGRPIWQAYLIFYHDPVAKTLNRRRLELTPSSSIRTAPTTIENFNPGGGAQPLSFYLNSGQPVSRLIENFDIVEHADLAGTYILSFDGVKPREGVNAESRSSLRALASVRN